MDLNYSHGRNGKKAQTTEVIPTEITMEDIAKGDPITKMVLRYLSKKQGQGESTVDPASKYVPYQDQKSREAERRAFGRLHKMEKAPVPSGVADRVPMEIRVKQLSLFPGIY
jgi:hypothetical protein